MIDVLEATHRLVKAVTGEEYGDGDVVTHVGKGTQWDDSKIFAIGSWRGELGDRLFKALERIGVECDSDDQADICSDCYKMIETRQTHYGWQPYYLVDTECQYVCFDCLDVSTDDVLEEFEYIDNADKAIPDVLGKHLETWGWTPYNGVFENGWHPGQTDNPQVIFDQIKDKHKDLSVVFRLDETSQFYIRFTAWTKDRNEDSDE